MTLTSDDIKKVAYLARLQVTEQEVAIHQKSLTSILNLLEEMGAINTDNVQPMSHPLDLHQPIREDVVSEPNDREAFQKIAPAVEAGLYLVPQVIE